MLDSGKISMRGRDSASVCITSVNSRCNVNLKKGEGESDKMDEGDP
jgi:hypothetical protein